ncbi:MAG: hypothetical protein GX085_03565 [Firmicutes bacterium]|nr:hypothetical protein [Bacillota bacterium]
MNNKGWDWSKAVDGVWLRPSEESIAMIYRPSGGKWENKQCNAKPGHCNGYELYREKGKKA